MVIDKRKVLSELKKVYDRRTLVRLKRIKDKKKLAEFESVIEIEEEEFNKSKIFTLLKEVIKDKDRKGVKCEYRIRRALAENLRNRQDKNKYGKVAKSLKYKDGKVRTTIPLGKIRII